LDEALPRGFGRAMHEAMTEAIQYAMKRGLDLGLK
jgi:hypothetical protein